VADHDGVVGLGGRQIGVEHEGRWKAMGAVEGKHTLVAEAKCRAQPAILIESQTPRTFSHREALHSDIRIGEMN